MKVTGSIRAALLVAACGASACSQTENCVVTCAQDADCPDGQSCTAAGKCSSESTCPCEPGAFLGCTEPGSAAFCADTGDTTRFESCGAPGCNAVAGRCNECVPGASTCAGDDVSLCGADGLRAGTETCVLPCVDRAEGGGCGHIVPVWLPDVCDAAAGMETVTFPAQVTLDTSLDTNCPEIVPQAGGPELCVYHASEITLSGTMTVVGSRPIAFVADHDLHITGNLIARAVGSTSGPGGGVETSGGGPVNQNAGGGAGFKAAGAAGGSTTANGGADNAGPILDPTTRAYFAGGPRSTSGGGGGGVLLISCRGKVQLAGSISAGGGGGAGGRDSLVVTAGTSLRGAHGGGAGGYVVFQGADVEVTGRAWANGGGGGAGCGADDCVGAPGEDAHDSLAPASGGITNQGGGNGGAGATRLTAVNVGIAGSSAGGGGGSIGWFHVYTPVERPPTITPQEASPAFSTNDFVETR